MPWLIADVGGFVYGFTLSLLAGAALLALPGLAFLALARRQAERERDQSIVPGCRGLLYFLLFLASAAVVLVVVGSVGGLICALRAHAAVNRSGHIPPTSWGGALIFLLAIPLYGIWFSTAVIHRKANRQDHSRPSQRFEVDQRASALDRERRQEQYRQQRLQQAACLPELLGACLIPGAELVSQIDLDGIKGGVIEMEYTGGPTETLFAYYAPLLPEGIFERRFEEIGMEEPQKQEADVTGEPRKERTVLFHFGIAMRAGDGRRMTVSFWTPHRVGSGEPTIYRHRIVFNCCWGMPGLPYVDAIGGRKPIYGGPGRIGMDRPSPWEISTET